MNCRLFYFISLWLLSTGCCKRGYSTVVNDEWILNIMDYGAKPDDGNDDADAFTAILSVIEKKPGKYAILIPKGDFHIRKRVNKTSLMGTILFKGEEGARLIFEGGGMFHLRAKGTSVNLHAEVHRGDSIMLLRKGDDQLISPGDLIHIQSDTPFETAWSYKENDIHRVATVEEGKLTLKSGFLFNYTPDSEKIKVTGYKPCFFSIDNLICTIAAESDSNSTARRTMMEMYGFSIDIRNTTLSYEGNKRYYHIGFSILASEGVYFSNMKLHNLMYPLLFNFCRNIKGINTVATLCRHAYTPAQACYNVYIENLRGINCQSVLDAHPSFLVHYKNVIDTLATQFPNCRSLGTVIEDTKIYVDPTAYQNYTYWSVQSLTKEYQHLYGEYDTRFSNVYWVPEKKTSLNGLNSFSCRRLIVENCTTSAVAFYGNQNILEQVLVKNSKLGVLRIDAHKTHVAKTVFDGTLFPDTKYVLRFSGSGESVFDSIVVKSYDAENTFLFDNFYNQPRVNSIRIEHSDIGLLKGLTNRVLYDKQNYSNLVLKSVKVAGFKDAIPKQFVDFQNVVDHSNTEWLRTRKK